MEKEQIDILKLDIEGAEKEVFSSSTLSLLERTRIIFIEVHDFLKYGCSENLFSAIKEYNYSKIGKKLKIILASQRGESMIFRKKAI